VRTLLLLAAVAVSATSASAACPPDSPEGLLECYTIAYAERDIEALESLVAEDYEWIAVTVPEAQVFTREESIRMSRGLFGDEDVTGISMEFGGDYKVVKGREENTWRIEGMTVTLTVSHVASEKPHFSTICATFYIRKIGGMSEGYEVYKEVTFEGVGCE